MAWTRTICRGCCCNSKFKKCLKQKTHRLIGRRAGHPAIRGPQSTNTLVGMWPSVLRTKTLPQYPRFSHVSEAPVDTFSAADLN